MNGTPEPGVSGVLAVRAAADAVARLPGAAAGLFAAYRQRYVLGSREAEVLDAADDALAADDWDRDRWWER